MMRTLVVVLLVALCVYARPTVPQIANQFQTNFTVRDLQWDPMAKALFHVELILDKITGGGRMTIAGEEIFPLYLSTNLIGTPDANHDGGMTAYAFEGNICWMWNVARDYLNILPLYVPADATFLGYKNLNGVPTQGWGWGEHLRRRNHSIEMWLTNTTHNAFPLQALLTESIAFGDVLLEFSGTHVGPVDPNTYAPPNLQCTPPWNGTYVFEDASEYIQAVMSTLRVLPSGDKDTDEKRVSDEEAVTDKDADPPIPTLAQQLWTNFTILPAELTHGVVAVQLWLDYVNGGGKLMLAGESQVPVAVETNFIVHPVDDTYLVGYWYEGPNCLNFGVPYNFLEIFPMHIKPNSTFLGYRTINGVKCQGWKFPAPDDGYGLDVEAWVTDVPSNAVLMLIHWTSHRSERIQASFVFSHTIVGPIDPAIYAPPNVNCFPTATDAAATLRQRMGLVA